MSERSGDERALYTIGVVERMTGLTARQIRYLESRGIVTPPRSRGRQRLYRRRDIDLMRQIKALRDQHLPLESIKGILRIREETE